METVRMFQLLGVRLSTAHSLGKLIEWKQIVSLTLSIIRNIIVTAHSLGKLIEWKPEQLSFCHSFAEGLDSPPHSLGKLIEWKLFLLPQPSPDIYLHSPLVGETN
jgi:hypothetical protein